MHAPHDALFRYTFSQPEHAAALIRSNLPDAIRQRIDWSSLSLVPGSFVDEQLAWRHSDLLYSAVLSGRRAFIYVLVEHQSQPDPMMSLRMLRYVVRCWDQLAKNEPEGKLLPAVIPLVLHHGSASWSAPVRLLELIDLDEPSKQALGPYLVDFGFVLDDLARQPDDELRQRALSHLALLTLSCLQRLPGSLNPAASLGEMVELMGQVLNAPSGLEALSAVLCYVLEVAEIKTGAVKQLLTQRLGRPAEEAFMTGAEELRQEGRAEGEIKGRAEILCKLIALRFGRIPPEVAERLRGASAEQLDLWAERVLTAQRLEALFA